MKLLPSQMHCANQNTNCKTFIRLDRFTAFCQDGCKLDGPVLSLRIISKSSTILCDSLSDGHLYLITRRAHVKPFKGTKPTSKFRRKESFLDAVIWKVFWGDSSTIKEFKTTRTSRRGVVPDGVSMPVPSTLCFKLAVAIFLPLYTGAEHVQQHSKSLTTPSPSLLASPPLRARPRCHTCKRLKQGHPRSGCPFTEVSIDADVSNSISSALKSLHINADAGNDTS